MTDHDKLREAINVAKATTPTNMHWYDGAIVQFSQELLRRLTAAAESTLPKTRMVEVWHVAGVYRDLIASSDWGPTCCACRSKEEADKWAKTWGESPLYACIRVTGPHMQEVPA